MNILLTTTAQLSAVRFDDAALFLIPLSAVVLAVSKKIYTDWAHK